ncbi:hypothetical protein ACFE04_029295 [Oxalis oulophora]
MPDNNNSNCLRMCSECEVRFTYYDDSECECDTSSSAYSCLSCRRWFCAICVQSNHMSAAVAVESKERMLMSCKYCNLTSLRCQSGRKFSEKVHPSRDTPDSDPPLLTDSGGEIIDHKVNSKSIQTDFLDHGLKIQDHGYPSPVSVCHSSCRSDEDQAEDSEKNFYSPLSDSDIDSSSTSARHENYSFKSVESSPTDSPNSWNKFSQERAAILKRPEERTESPEITDDLCSDFEKSQRPLDFENIGRIWYPPPPEDEYDDVDIDFISYDDDDDDDIGDSGFSTSSSLPRIFPMKEKHSECNKEPLKAVIQGHFRALVLQLLQDEGIVGKEDGADNWLDILTTIAWQAANFVKPDTSRGGSMDPGNYVKVKCIASGSPNQRYGGALEYQKVSNQLSSFDTLLQEETDHLKMIMSKIEALRPNVLLVEKSASTYAQEYLLAKEISLVLNVKRPVLERIARCTGALISPTIESISSTRLGHCELFRIEKVTEEHETANQFSKRPSKTLMFFEGCPRRLGCTILLRGTSYEELKKVKHVAQYAVFAAHHLSLETSFLADEGASLPKMTLKPSISKLERIMDDNSAKIGGAVDFLKENRRDCLSDTYADALICKMEFDSSCLKNTSEVPCATRNVSQVALPEEQTRENMPLERTHEFPRLEKVYNDDVSSEVFHAADSEQSILVSFSSRCVLKEMVCERSRQLRIKFYGSFDKPLGRFLRDDLFDQISRCQSCDEPAEAHVQCYTHQQGNLTINVKRLPYVNLPGERDGKIWMWHRCLRCAQIDGIPPANRRIIMSDAAWGLSFGKFLELSFSNHATANRVATCGHSLQRDCLRYYGFGSMVAFFRYSPIEILAVHLPPSVLEFNSPVQQQWIKKEATELMAKIETLSTEISDAIDCIEEKYNPIGRDLADTHGLQEKISDMKDQLKSESMNYHDLLKPALTETSQPVQTDVGIIELNRLRRALLIGSHVWDYQLHSLDAVLKKNYIVKPAHEETASTESSFVPNKTFLGDIPSDGSALSEKIDSAWTGTELSELEDNSSSFKRLTGPMRVHSFNSALRSQEIIKKQFLTLRSFHASGEYRSMIRDPISNIMKTYSQVLPFEAQKLNLILTSTPSYISCASHMAEGARLLLGQSDIVIAVYDNDPISIISYALSSKEYEDCVFDKSVEHRIQSPEEFYGSEELSSSRGSMFADNKKSPHLTVSFGDDSLTGGGKVRFSVTCYFAKQFDSLRQKCCPSKVDFLCSLSRCQTWSAQGGKSNVYFAKSLDERFIIKQVKKTELDSFEEFAAEYFKYLTDSLSSGSPTCLAKILGIYQVSVKHERGGKETKMELMVMENLFFNRGISRIYDLKGSARSRYNPDTTGKNKILLDMNLLETLRTEPIFLRSKAKRSLERAIWNDTSFLASVDVMDYSLLVGVDKERNELVLGIIDFMRQYTWDKHLETWVKASGILGGPKNASPTIISPKQYKKRFRKAMTTYFLTVPDQWSS